MSLNLGGEMNDTDRPVFITISTGGTGIHHPSPPQLSELIKEAIRPQPLFDPKVLRVSYEGTSFSAKSEARRVAALFEDLTPEDVYQLMQDEYTATH